MNALIMWQANGCNEILEINIIKLNTTILLLYCSRFKCMKILLLNIESFDLWLIDWSLIMLCLIMFDYVWLWLCDYAWSLYIFMRTVVFTRTNTLSFCVDCQLCFGYNPEKFYAGGFGSSVSGLGSDFKLFRGLGWTRRSVGWVGSEKMDPRTTLCYFI